jgi:DivIVA domain-containing protein
VPEPDVPEPDVPGLPADRRRLVDHVRSVRFTPVRIREGYEMTTVDALLDRVAEAASRGEEIGPLLDIDLPQVRLREGYDPAQVNAFLADLRGWHGAGAAHPLGRRAAGATRLVANLPRPPAPGDRLARHGPRGGRTTARGEHGHVRPPATVRHA